MPSRDPQHHAGGCGRRHLSPLGALWTLPNTLIGLGFALLSGAWPRPEGGLLVARSRRGLARLALARRGYAAITFGRVVVCVGPVTPHLLVHEAHHVRQYEALGPLFIPLYLWHQARRGYAHNPLELEAEACASAWAHTHGPTLDPSERGSETPARASTRTVADAGVRAEAEIRTGGEGGSSTPAPSTPGGDTA